MRSWLALPLATWLAACATPAPPSPPPATPSPMASSSPDVTRHDVSSQWRPAGTAGTEATPPSSGFAPMPAGPPPAVREAGNQLHVDHPPATRPRAFSGRLRTHTEGALSAGSRRVWVGPPVPTYVPLEVDDGVELFVLDPQPDGSHLAFFREPYDQGSCSVSTRRNCRYRAALFRPDASVAWALPLDPLLSSHEGLEIQDIRLVDGVLYLNEACQSYSRESGGKCSSLVALEPASKRVLWRTPPLTSNNVILPLGAYVLVGYGFTAEPDRLSLVRRSDGAVVSTLPLTSAHAELTLTGASDVRVGLYGGSTVDVNIEGLDTDRPRLRRR